MNRTIHHSNKMFPILGTSTADYILRCDADKGINLHNDVRRLGLLIFRRVAKGFKFVVISFFYILATRKMEIMFTLIEFCKSRGKNS